MEPDVKPDLLSMRIPQFAGALEANEMFLLSIGYSHLDAAFASDLVKNGITPMAWTVDDAKSMRSLARMNPAIMICTNRPDTWGRFLSIKLHPKFHSGEENGGFNVMCALVNNVYCVGRNYQLHAAELGNAVPEEPMIFLKPSHAVVPLDGGVLAADGPRQSSFEGELVIQLAEDYAPGKTVDELVKRWPLASTSRA